LAGLVCAQVVIPVWATFQGVPHKFGFHMFTGYEPVAIKVLDSSGDTIDVDLSDWIVVRREDVDWASSPLPSVLCADVNGAATVVIRQWKSDREFVC
jgi:hypothetical protein